MESDERGLEFCEHLVPTYYSAREHFYELLVLRLCAQELDYELLAIRYCARKIFDLLFALELIDQS